MSEIENRERKRRSDGHRIPNQSGIKQNDGRERNNVVCLFVFFFFFLFPIDLLCFFTPSLLYSVRGQNEDVAAASAKLHYLFYFHHPRKTRNCGVVFVEKPRFTRFGAVVGGKGGGGTLSNVAGLHARRSGEPENRNLVPGKWQTNGNESQDGTIIRKMG